MAKETKETTRADQLAVVNKAAASIAQSIYTNVMTTRTAAMRELLDPRRNLDTECGYVENPTAEDFNIMYKKEGVAERCVKIVPEECWKAEPVVSENDETDETEFEAAWDELLNKFTLWSIMLRADILSGIGEFGIILFGINDGQELHKPVEATKGERELMYIRVFDQSVIKIQTTETDAKNERFGQPTMYSIDFELTNDHSDSKVTKQVHWTRTIHISDNNRMDEIRGVPRMRPIYNRLQDLRKLYGGSAEMFWQGAFPGLSFEVDPKVIESGAGDIDNDALKEVMQTYANGLQRWISTVGVSVKSLAPQVADPTSHVKQQLQAIAISLDIPLRIFMGTEEGKLAGGQDAEVWASRCGRRQRNHITPKIIKPLIIRLQEMGVLPETPETPTATWPDMLIPSDKEKAETNKIIIETMKSYVQGNVEMLIPPMTFLMKYGGMDQDEAKAVMEEVEKQLAEEADEISDPDLDDSNDNTDENVDDNEPS